MVVHTCAGPSTRRVHIHTQVDTHGWMHCNTHVSAFTPSYGAHTQSCPPVHTHLHTHSQGCTRSPMHDHAPPALVHVCTNTRKCTQQARQRVHTHAPGPLHTCPHCRLLTHTHGSYIYILAHIYTLLYYTYTLILLLFHLQVTSNSS